MTTSHVRPVLKVPVPVLLNRQILPVRTGKFCRVEIARRSGPRMERNARSTDLPAKKGFPRGNRDSDNENGSREPDMVRRLH